MAGIVNSYCTGAIFVAAIFLLQPVTALKTRGGNCFSQDDCDTKFCSRRKVCECFPVHDYTTGSKVEQEYNKGICQSKVMSTCTLPTLQRDGLPELQCIENAKCVYAPFGRGSVQIFGVCECDPGFQAIKNNSICLAKMEVSFATKTVDTKETLGNSTSIVEKKLTGKPSLTPNLSNFATSNQSSAGAMMSSRTMGNGTNETTFDPSTANLTLRIKTFAYMLSLAFNSFVKLVTRT